MSARQDISTLKPWTAVERKDGKGWDVVSPSRYGAEAVLVAAYLSQEDAELIADAPATKSLLMRMAVRLGESVVDATLPGGGVP